MSCNELPKASNFYRRTKAGRIQLELCDWKPTLAAHAIRSLTQHSDTFTCDNVFPLQARKHLVWQNTAGLNLF